MLGLELALRGILEGAPIGIAALGFALIFRTAKELHFAYGVTIALGGYLTYTLSSVGLPLPISGLLAALICAAGGGVLRYGAYRKLHDHYAVLLFSFGLAIVLENVLQLLYGAHDITASSDWLNHVVTLVPGTTLSARVIHLLGLVLMVVAWLVVRWLVIRTRTGLGLTAVVRDAEMAELVGVKAERMKVLAYVVGSGLAGIAGALTVVSSGVRPSLGFELLLYGFIATLLAGMAFTQAALWGLALGVALNLSAWVLPAQYRTLVVFVLIAAYLVVRMRRMPRFAL